MSTKEVLQQLGKNIFDQYKTIISGIRGQLYLVGPFALFTCKCPRLNSPNSSQQNTRIISFILAIQLFTGLVIIVIAMILGEWQLFSKIILDVLVVPGALLGSGIAGFFYQKRKESETELTNDPGDRKKRHESEIPSKLIYENMLNGYFTVEPVRTLSGELSDVRFINFNPGFERQTNLKTALFLGKTWMEVTGYANPKLNVCQEVLQTGQPQIFEWDEPGRDRHYLVKAFKIGDNSVGVVFDDITPYRNALREVDFLNQKFEEQTWERNNYLQSALMEKNTGSNCFGIEIKMLASYVVTGDLQAEATAGNLVQAVCETPESVAKAFIIQKAITEIVSILEQRCPWVTYFINLKRIRSIDFTTIEGTDRLANIFINSIAALAGKIHQLNPGNGDNEIVEQICNYVLMNIDYSITVKGTAEALFLHRSYLSEVFKQNTGQRLSEYITMVKMERAKKLFDEGQLLSYQIAELLGYKDVDYFGRIFKKYTGVSPSKYKD